MRVPIALSMTTFALTLTACSGELHENVPAGAEADGTTTPSSAEGAGGDVHFDVHIQADIDAFSCSSVGCHGSGLGGFTLTKAATGDALRANYDTFKQRASDDERSKVLVKAVGGEGHVGGIRFAKDSATYARWLAWIRKGQPR